VSFFGLGLFGLAAGQMRDDGTDREAARWCSWSRDSLIAAVARDEFDSVQAKLEDGADPDGDARAETPLTCAARAGRIEIAELLLDAGADPNHEALDETPLSRAVRGHHVEIVELLVDAGADPTPPAVRAAVHCVSGDDDAPTHEAMLEGMLEAGGDPDGGEEGPSLLLCASYVGHTSVVDLLIGHGADPNHGGAVPSFWLAGVVGLIDDSASEEVRSVLPEPRDASVDNVPPLVGAAWQHRTEVVADLLAAGTDPDLPIDEAFTAMHAAAVRGHHAAVDLLLLHGADPTPPVRSGVATPAEMAQAAGHGDIADLLDAAAESARDG
jgi:ankyrin repeat protein